jgi:hypothetical protein
VCVICARSGSPSGLPQSGGSLIELREIIRANDGRLFIRGKSEILTSDDNGNSWQYRFGTFFTNGLQAGPWRGEIGNVVRAGQRWAMPLQLGDLNVRDRKFNWVLLSEDNGNTWFRREIPSNFGRVFSMLSSGNRIIAFGNRGSVWISDGSSEVQPDPKRLFVRAGDTARFTIPRPPISGVVNMRYSAVQDRSAMNGSVATAGTDYTPTAGVLEWQANDLAEKIISVPTLDTQQVGNDKQFLLQLVSDNVDLNIAMSVPATILNTSQVQAAGIELLELDSLQFVPGQSVGKSFRVVLTRQPSASVVVSIAHAAVPAATLGVTSLTFTSVNWKTPQTVMLTPLSSGVLLGSYYLLNLTANSTDTLYQNIGTYVTLYRYGSDALFQSGFEANN